MFTLSCTICECLATGITLGEAMDNFTLKHNDECLGASSRQEVVIPDTPYQLPTTVPTSKEFSIPSVWINPQELPTSGDAVPTPSVTIACWPPKEINHTYEVNSKDL